MILDPPRDDDPDRSYPPDEVALRAFYDSWEWARFAYRIKKERGRRCEMCGATPADGVCIVADHIRPVRYYWHLRLTETNIQILCDDDNRGKGSWDTADFREPLFRPLDDIDVALVMGDRSELKRAITTAHSVGALSERETGDLIQRYGLAHE